MDNKKQSGFSKFINLIKELSKTPRGKSILFFGFYAIFFVVLFIALQFNNKATPLIKDSSMYEIGTKYTYSSIGISNNNYNFKYTITLDNQISLYEGKKLDKKEEFSLTKDNVVTNYFRNDDIFYINDEEKEIATNPYILEYFLDYSNIKSMLDKATFISKTNYDSGSTSYSASISTTTLLELTENSKVDLDDLPNEITLTTDDNNNLVDINLDISSYTKYKELSSIIGTVHLEYSNFGKVKSIDN